MHWTVVVIFTVILFPQMASAQSLLTRLEETGPYSYAVDHTDAYPFSPAYILRFSLPDTCEVVVQVRQVMSSKDSSLLTQPIPVWTLFTKTLNPGAYQATWDGKDSTGTVVARGLYIFYVRMVNERAAHFYKFEAQTRLMPHG